MFYRVAGSRARQCNTKPVQLDDSCSCTAVAQLERSAADLVQAEVKSLLSSAAALCRDKMQLPCRLLAAAVAQAS